MTDMNILDLFLKASLLVKLIMLILIGFSIASWAIIIQRTRILNAAAREAEAFEDKFWSGIELSRLYQESQGKRDNLTGSEQIFYSGFKEFVRLHRANSHAPEAVVEGASRAMRISMNRELENLETHIPFPRYGWLHQPVYWSVWYGLGDHARLYRPRGGKTSNTANGCARYRRSVDCDCNWSVCRYPGSYGLQPPQPARKQTGTELRQLYGRVYRDSAPPGVYR